jgi:hypothetical protein
MESPAPARPRATAVMVTYNSKPTLPRALTGLQECVTAGLLDSVIVVDNASQDGTAAYVRATHPSVRLIESGANLGFGRGNNRGFALTQTEYVLLLNPDASVAPDVLRELIAFLDSNPRAGIAGPAIREPGQPPQPAFRFPTPGSILRAALGRVGGKGGNIAVPVEPRRYAVDWLCGAVLLARRSLLFTLQGFDPRFFLYFEETDLCLRARQAGFETWVLGDLVAGHHAGSSAKATKRLMWDGCIAEHYFRSRYYYLRKHHGKLLAWGTEGCELLLMALRAGARRLCGKTRDEREAVRWASPKWKLPAEVFDEPGFGPSDVGQAPGALRSSLPTPGHQHANARIL